MLQVTLTSSLAMRQIHPRATWWYGTCIGGLRTSYERARAFCGCHGVCGRGRGRGRGTVVVVATTARNFGSGGVLVVTVIGAEVSGDTLFAVSDLARAHGFASSAFCGCHVVWSWS